MLINTLILYCTFCDLHSREKAEMSTVAPLPPDKNLNYEQLIGLLEEGEIVLIDVREPKELKETGVLPGSHNIPCQIQEALETPSDQFENLYCFAKPTKDSPLVFSCRSGKRSLAALQVALGHGYHNAKHYTGGWLDWEKHNKQHSS